ncbi:MAG: NrsF family protein [Pseudomonadota bacterium]
MKNLLIEQLVDQLQPKPVLRNTTLWIFALIGMFIFTVIIFLTLGFRSDQSLALFWKPSIFILAWLSSLLLLTDIARPGQKIKLHHFLPIALACVILIWQIFFQIKFQSFAQIQSLLDFSALYCLSLITLGGAIILGLVWKYWLQLAASVYPSVLGALSGFSAGCLAATSYSLHCNHDAVLYIGLYYFIPIFLLTLLGLGLGKKYLQW